jgi:hypothetical protein
MAADLVGLLRTLSEAQVAYIIVGGVAANLHGALRTTLDLDVVYQRDRDNIARLVKAIAPLRPYLRGAPAGLPFAFDESTIARGLNFTLVTDMGDLDLLGEVTGAGSFGDIVQHSQPVDVGGITCLLVDLPTLIRMKRAAGRARDRESLAELEALLEERDR